ncbi:BspA family leucine-rich repeat surface protein [Companilactobacillus muriivasis]|uniref:BspA family leucine-rich repeat surface protein n=1 Tax=Companilactobacillus muriivasis TaxID=3081444 RepID=UPI0030C6CC24
MTNTKWMHKQKYMLRLIIFLCSMLFPLLSSQVVHADTNDVQDVISQNKIATDDNNSTSTIIPLVAVTAADPTDIASGTFGFCDWVIDSSGKLSFSSQGNSASIFGEVNNTNNVIDAPWYSYRNQVTSVYVGKNIIANNNSSYVFSQLPNATSIDVENLDVQYASNMSSMFANDDNLTSITGLEDWNTSSVTNMAALFSGDYILEETDGIENWNTSEVTIMSSLFNNAKEININGLENWDTSSVTNMSFMFENTKIVDFSPIKNWDVSKLKTMESMFYGNNVVTSLDFSNWKLNELDGIGRTFAGCIKLTEIVGLNNFNSGRLSNFSYTFLNDRNLTSLADTEKWNTSNVITMAGTFSGCIGLLNLDLREWDTSSVEDMSHMFESDSNLKENTLYGLDKFNTNNVTNMSYMFASIGFEVLDLSNFNTSKVTNMNHMFVSTKKLQQIIGDFDTSSVEDLSYLFYNSNVTDFDELNISNWKLSKVTNMSGMFWGNSSKSLVFTSNWNTSNVKSFYAMFNSMPNLEALDISGFDTTNATDVQYMFGGDKSLWKLTLGPKSVLTNLTGPVQATDVHLLAPVPGTVIKDDSTDESYSAISDKWQVVDTASGGTDHEPLGDLASAQDIMDKFSTVGNPVTTYVWQQQTKGDMKMTVPDIDFGTTSNASGLVRRKSDFAIDVTNNNYPTDAVPSDLSVSMDAPLTDETDKTKTLNDVLVFKDKYNNESILSSTDTKIYSGDIVNGSNTISWDNDHGILLNMNNDRYAANGHYSTTLKWTLTNSL